MKNTRLWIALAIALFTVISYYSRSSVNPVTGEKQHVGTIRPDQEIALGLQAAPQMAQQYGGETTDPQALQLVESVGRRVLEKSSAGKSPYQYTFHALADPKTINAFALPGGQVFITMGLLKKLRTEGELAGVLGHEIGHVVDRHGAEHMAKQQLSQGITGAAVLASYDPDRPGTMAAGQLAQMVAGMVDMKFGRNDELEADHMGLKFMSEAGYDPRAMLGVMEVLKTAGGGRQPEFFSTHPNPENRIGHLQEEIKALFPGGVPAGLTE